MPTDALIEQRLSAVEAAVAELRERLAKVRPNWLQEIAGSMKDEPDFEKVVEYGRAFRAGNDPTIGGG